MNRIALLAALALCLPAGGLLAPPAHAGDEAFSVETGAIVALSLGHGVILPVPEWGKMDGKPGAEMIELIRTPNSPTVETLEFIPAGDDIDNWTQMIAAVVVDEPDYTTTQLEDGIVNSFEQGCEASELKMGIIAKAEGDLPDVFLVACGAYRQNGMTGTAAGAGEVFIGVVTKTDAGVAKLYQEWRGPAFSVADRSSWPVDEAELQAAIDRFHNEASAQ